MTAEMTLAAGITYRQMDWWCKAGYLHPEGGGRSGHPRRWPEAELEVARRMGRLTEAGIAVSVAAEFAREKWPAGEIAPGIAVHVSEGEPA